MSEHIALEEEKPSEPFTAVLLYMEKLGCLDSVDRWKEIRELRNAVNPANTKTIRRRFTISLWPCWQARRNCCAGTTCS